MIEDYPGALFGELQLNGQINEIVKQEKHDRIELHFSMKNVVGRSSQHPRMKRVLIDRGWVKVGTCLYYAFNKSPDEVKKDMSDLKAYVRVTFEGSHFRVLKANLHTHTAFDGSDRNIVALPLQDRTIELTANNTAV